MDIVNKENEDEETEDHATTTSSSTPTCSSAWLAAKSKKLMEMETRSIPMSIETEIQEMEIQDLKK